MGKNMFLEENKWNYQESELEELYRLQLRLQETWKKHRLRWLQLRHRLRLQTPAYQHSWKKLFFVSTVDRTKHYCNIQYKWSVILAVCGQNMASVLHSKAFLKKTYDTETTSWHGYLLYWWNLVIFYGTTHLLLVRNA